jgi:Flp pilus assembly protein TadG
MPDARTVITYLKAIVSATHGSSAIEFGLLAPILIFLTIGVVDLGIGLYQKQQVQAAAQAGAQAALSGGASVNTSAATFTTNIENAVSSATNLSSISASAATSCGCPSGTSVTPVNTCGTACQSGANPNTYVTVGATATYKPLLSYPALGNSVTLHATAMVRIK